jgi:hypothetical protein
MFSYLPMIANHHDHVIQSRIAIRLVKCNLLSPAAAAGPSREGPGEGPRKEEGEGEGEGEGVGKG